MKKKTVADIVKQLKRNKNNGATCAMLIGAGCSVQAGIPTAAQIVREVVRKKCEDYEGLHDKLSYADCMMELDPLDRHKVLADYIDNAEINRAHVAIAQLMKHSFVDRVLTTNFDPLVMQACAMVNEFPAIYDLATSTKFAPGLIRDLAVFHLHGQRDGFFQYHDDEQFAGLSHAVRSLFADTNTNRTWIVVGYSGDNDPVFNQLAELHDFDRNLYWVTYENKEPSPQVQDGLAVKGKAAYWVPAKDADTFLYQLAREMGALPPELFGSPFTHLKNVMARIGDLPSDELQDTKIPWLKEANEMIDQAISSLEMKEAPSGNAKRKKVFRCEKGKRSKVRKHPQLLIRRAMLGLTWAQGIMSRSSNKWQARRI